MQIGGDNASDREERGGTSCQEDIGVWSERCVGGFKIL
jgi:hypothetical protein